MKTPSLIPCLLAWAWLLAGALALGAACNTPPSATFTVFLPRVGVPPDEEGQGWPRPAVWEHLPDAADDSITVPNGRPIYALIVSGFGSNKYLDELMTYNFARHLMARGAYVHYAWWNNLLAPYMERPLHHSQSHPGGLSFEALGNLLTAADASSKAAPGEDYQFVADAGLFLSAIRQNNPSAIIIVVGHSMGGGSVVHLGAQTDVVIDILAPFDPTNNRNYPWSGPLAIGPPPRPDFNWTRWRVTRDTFLGYRSAHWGGIGVGCVASGPWLKDVNDRDNDVLCADTIFVHDAPTLQFGSHVINLHHGWQNEWFFPFDYLQNYSFGHSPPPGGSTSQAPIPTTPELCGFPPLRCPDPGGWPALGDANKPCCETGNGAGWPRDGHGEIVGYRGPLPHPVPLGVRVRTSPQCGDCPNPVWPARSESAGGIWSTGNGAGRVARLQELEMLPEATAWSHRPTNPNLCLVSPGLINLFDVMNKPPVANAGGNQTIECDGSHSAQVTLDGSKSTDPDGDNLDYRWNWDSGAARGAVATVRLPTGPNCVSLTVRDPSGHIDRRTATVTVADTIPPELSVRLSPRLLWPPNHKMVNIRATVQASDSCGSVAGLKLLSIVCNQADNGVGDGTTTHDIAAKIGMLDLDFQLRAERAGNSRDRIYTVTYQATDDSGNQARVSQEVVVPHNAKSYQDWLKVMKN